MATSRSRSPTSGLIGILQSMRKSTNEQNLETSEAEVVQENPVIQDKSSTISHLDTSEAEVFQESPVIQDKSSPIPQTEIAADGNLRGETIEDNTGNVTRKVPEFEFIPSTSTRREPILEHHFQETEHITVSTSTLTSIQKQLQMITANLSYMNPIVSELKTVHDEWQKCQVETGSDEEDAINLTSTTGQCQVTDKDKQAVSDSTSAVQAGSVNTNTASTTVSSLISTDQLVVPSGTNTKTIKNNMTSSSSSNKSEQNNMPEAEMSGIPVHNSVLNSMANSVNKKEVLGPNIDEGLSAIVIDLLQLGMNKECKDKLIDSLHKPANCKRLDVVLVNTGIFTNVNRETKSEDLGLQHIQKPLIKGLTGLVYTINKLIKAEKGESAGPSNQEMLEDLSKSFSLLATSSHELDLRRRRNFKSELKDIYKPLCADNNPVTELLFGNDLGKETKELTDERKAVVTKSYPNTKKLYRYKPYPFLGQGHQTNNFRNRQSYQYRGRGTRPYYSQNYPSKRGQGKKHHTKTQ